MHIVKKYLKYLPVYVFIILLVRLLFPLVSNSMSETASNFIFHLLNHLFVPYNLSYFNYDLYRILELGHFYDIVSPANILSMLVFALGIILYYTKKETRIMRLAFAVFMYSGTLSILIVFFSFIVFSSRHTPQMHWLFMMSHIIMWIAWVYVSAIFYKTQSKNRTPVLKPAKKSTPDQLVVVDTSSVNRFFHHVFDFILSILITSLPLLRMMPDFWMNIEKIIGESNVLVMIILLGRIIYYVFFEAILNTSPGKILTDSVIVMRNNNKINIKAALLRTLCRHIPFEPFSFLFQKNGWHDTLTNTKVIKEENTGLPLKRYRWLFILIPAFIITVLSVKGINSYVEREKYKRDTFYKNAENISRELKNINPHQVYAFFPTGSHKYYWGTVYYLKPESIADSIAVFSVLKNDRELNNDYEIEEIFENKKTSIQKVRIPLKNLDEVYPKKYKDYRKKTFKGIPMPGETGVFSIYNVYHIYEPALYVETTGSRANNYISMRITNRGWPAKIKHIENIKGDLQWHLDDEIVLPRVKHYSQTSIAASNYKTQYHYVAKVYVEDTSLTQHKYILEIKGNGFERTMYRLYE